MASGALPSLARALALVVPAFWLLTSVGQVSGDLTKVTQVLAVLRGRAELPCDLATTIPDDEVTLVLWYTNDSGTPIYSLDVRNPGLTPETADHLPAEVLGNRALFRVVTSTEAFLQLQPVKARDEGMYRCRVDFRKSRTRNQLVNLTVIVPPDDAFIVDETGQDVSSVWNVNQGSKLILSCEAVGGKPTPRVTWWMGSKLLQETSEPSSTGKVRSDLILPRLTRGDLNMNLTCQASNTNLTVPVAKTITLDLNLHPLDVRILGGREPLSATKHYELECESSGSRPPPTITWMRNSKRLKHSKETLSPDGNTTTSRLAFTPTRDDHGKYITCRAENLRMPGSVLEDSWKLDIYYVPHAQLDLGSSLKKDNLKEGDDVYFECTIRANPRAYRVDWKFEGRFLQHNISAGIIISNQSLVLQKVRRTSAGAYTCIAKNVEGDGESNSVTLKIKHAPACRPGQKTVYGVARHEAAKIVCEVKANPHQVMFKWAFNNTSEFLDIAQAKFTSGGLRSTITYTPRTESDYGVLYCWGRNDIGEQKEPCRFMVIAAGPPDNLHNCTIQNQTEDSIEIQCTEGFDGGMPQFFILEVFDATSHQLKTNQSNPTANFHVNGLEPGTGFMLQIYAANAKGKSESLALTASTRRVAEKRTGSPAAFPITPILGVLIGVVAALVLVAILIVIVMRLRAPDDERKTDLDTESLEKEPISRQRSRASLKKELEDMDNAEEKNPDVVPNEVDDTKGELNNAKHFQIYENVSHGPAQNLYDKNIRNQDGRINPVTKPEETIYADLKFLNNEHSSNTIIGRSEPTVYAEILHTRKAPATQDPDEDDVPTAETPLMNSHRESTVQGYGTGSPTDGLQPTTSTTRF